MLHAPITDRKNKPESNSSAMLSKREQQNQAVNWSGQFPSTRDRSNLAAIQQGYGNQGALRMSRSEKGRSPSIHPTSRGLLQRKCACGNGAGAAGTCTECQEKQGIALQTKLRVSEPGDRYEQEADRVAEEVIRSQTMLDKKQVLNSISTSFTSIQRQEEVLEDNLERSKEELDMESELGLDEEEIEPEDDEGLTPDETGMPKLETGVISPAQYSPIDVPSGQGKPIDPVARDFMEQKIGFNFSKVRIHDDTEAAASAKHLHAHAYTIRSDIYFNQDQYNPRTTDGLKLLAHELTHVVQQTGLPQSSNTRNTLVQRQSRRRRQRGDAPHRERRGRQRSRCGPQTCNNQCTSSRNPLVHHPICGNETCGAGGAANANDFIRHIDVSLTTQEVKLEWGNATRSNRVEPGILSSPNPSATPQGTFTVGQKCGSCHTNQSGDGMAWFTGFHNGLQFGFHNSQRVARGVRSHGCVRIPCATARRIHDNTASGTTTVCIHTGNGWGCNHHPPSANRSGAGGSDSGGGKSAGQELLSVLSNEFKLIPEMGNGEEEEKV
jgi:Domain of unknown function (DUF4157)/L,D-transpeptidase catalytic domain